MRLWIKRTGGWFFPFIAIIAMLEVVGAGILFKGVVSTQQVHSTVILKNEGNILKNEDTLSSNENKIDQDGVLIRENRKILDQIAKDTQKLLEKKCH